MKLVAQGLSDVGRKRDHNEDSLLIDEELGLYVIADGMGGHAGGATASRLAVETIQSRLRDARSARADLFREDQSLEESPLRELLREAVEDACHSIYAVGQANPALAGMGTTVTAALAAGSNVLVAHVGDSRMYVARNGRLYQVSEDHSFVNEQLKAGIISAEEARNSRHKNVITRSVGFEPDVEVDLMGLEVEPGDRLVVCCDGLSNMLADEEILGIVEEATLESAPRRLVELANQRGGDDNISVIVVHAT